MDIGIGPGERRVIYQRSRRVSDFRGMSHGYITFDFHCSTINEYICLAMHIHLAYSRPSMGKIVGLRP
jgi:hypothetical protein